ncbi:tRNA(m5U54)methyltransferase [Parahypoxylon ruwenzoriense]
MRLYATAVPRLFLRSRGSVRFPTLRYSPAFSVEHLIPLTCRRHAHTSEPFDVNDWPQQQPDPHRGRKGKKESGPLSTDDVIRLMKEPASRKTAPDGQTKMQDQEQMTQQQQQQQQPDPRPRKRSFPQDKSHRGLKREQKKNQKKARQKEAGTATGSADEVLAIDVQNLIDSLNLEEDGKAAEEEVAGDPVAAAAAGENVTEAPASEALPEEGTEIEVGVVELSSTGEGLALQKGSKRVYVVPFAVPGDTAKVKVFRHLREGYTIADFISVVTPSPSRDDSRIQCKYFATCSGCQFQMLDYGEQLRLKKRIVEKAFRNFSQLPPELIPAIQDTIGSPLQYNYRTKLTPHFDGPQGWRKGKNPFDKCPPIGFMPKGKRSTMDIEDCPIGTDAVRLGMQRERERMTIEYGKYTRGATILLRESTRRVFKPGAEIAPPSPSSPRDSAAEEPPRSPSPLPPPDSVVKVETDEYVDFKTCVTNSNNTSTDTTSTSTAPPIEFLIDAYSGSGLFTITLSPLLRGGSVGIDIADSSIEYATRNARANQLPPNRARFVAADARDLFTPAVRARYPADRTVVVLDPPRKGCDADFLRQLLSFAPRRVVYVSCNVHTQARDVGVLVRGEEEGVKGEDNSTATTTTATTATTTTTGKKRSTRYSIESLRGFDFFPQTGHVEGVAVLNRVDD